MQYCTKCLIPSTRPRITFNEEGVCNACQHAEKKKKEVDWEARKQKLIELCDKYRRDEYWDIIIPLSGGKDSSYIAYMMKHEFGMHPLCVTCAPPMSTDLGKDNLHRMIRSGTGYDHIFMTPNPIANQKMCRMSFIDQGRPKHPYVAGIFTMPLRIAVKFNIPLVMYAEEGEIEYGGTSRLSDHADCNRQDIIDIYLSGNHVDKYLGMEGLTKDDLRGWELPTDEELARVKPYVAHWSYFENFDPYLHYKVCEEKTGYKAAEGKQFGTFDNWGQVDEYVLHDMHIYLMFIKFGFGRTTADASIEIRFDRMKRQKGVELANQSDGAFPGGKRLEDFLEFMKMTEDEFWDVIDKWANRKVLEKVDGEWKLKESLRELRANPKPHPIEI